MKIKLKLFLGRDEFCMEYAKDIVLDFKKGQAINVRTKKVSFASKVLDKILKHKIITTIVTAVLSFAVLDFILIASFINVLINS